jgi:hypothetical protein
MINSLITVYLTWCEYIWPFLNRSCTQHAILKSNRQLECLVLVTCMYPYFTVHVARIKPRGTPSVGGTRAWSLFLLWTDPFHWWLKRTHSGQFFYSMCSIDGKKYLISLFSGNTPSYNTLLTLFLFPFGSNVCFVMHPQTLAFFAASSRESGAGCPFPVHYWAQKQTSCTLSIHSHISIGSFLVQVFLYWDYS